MLGRGILRMWDRFMGVIKYPTIRDHTDARAGLRRKMRIKVGSLKISPIVVLDILP